jgi:hypothetical protein
MGVGRNGHQRHSRSNSFRGHGLGVTIVFEGWSPMVTQRSQRWMPTSTGYRATYL